MPSVTPGAPDGQQAGRDHVDGCTGRLLVVGYVHRSEHTRTDCQQPLRAVCDAGCGAERFWRCDCSAATKCPDCAERRRRLVARLVDLGTRDALGRDGTWTYFLTVTAPGTTAGHRQWVQVGGAGVRRLPADRPVCGCEAVWESLQPGDWNRQESACWNRLRTALARRSGGLTYIGSVEVQDGKRADGRTGRGMLHRHVVLASATPLTAAEVGQLALSAGYGCVHDLQPIHDAGKAAWYISKYVTKSSGDRGEVPWRADVEVVDKRTGEITVRRLETIPTFRTWSSAQSWGYTLKGLREIARIQARARARYLRELQEALNAAGADGDKGHTVASCQPTRVGDPPTG